MEKSVKITLIIVGAIILLALIGLSAVSLLAPVSTANTISANGMSELSVVPDKVSLNFNVETKGSDAKEATDKNSEIVDDLITNLVKQGFNRADIQTSGFSVYEDFVWTQNTQRSVGFKATHQIIVKMNTSQTDKIGDAIDAGIDANATLSYINFELSQDLENKYKAQAIEMAAKDAKTKAESLARGLDRQLGKLISVSDSSFNYSPWIYYDSVASSGGIAELKQAATNIQPSERTISASVSVVYSIR